jgi:hypothetical protein
MVLILVTEAWEGSWAESINDLHEFHRELQLLHLQLGLVATGTRFSLKLFVCTSGFDILSFQQALTRADKNQNIGALQL